MEATKKIDLAKTSRIAKWIRSQQEINPNGIKMLFSDLDDNTALALETIPTLIEVLKSFIETTILFEPLTEEEEKLILDANKIINCFE